MEWIQQYKFVIYSLTENVVMISVILTIIYAFFTEEGKRFRRAKKNNEPIKKGEYNSVLRKIILILIGGVFPILFILSGILIFYSSK